MLKVTGYENLSNKELIDSFLSKYPSKGTQSTYRSALNKFNRFVNKPFDSVTKRDMIDFNGSLKTPSDYTRQREHATVRSFYEFLVWAGVVSGGDNPSQGTFKKMTPTSKLSSKCLTVEEVEAMKKVAYPVARDFAMVAVLATTGTRINEMLGMKQSHCFRKYVKELDGEGWFITIDGKGSKSREVYLPDGTVWALERLLGHSLDPSQDEYFFQRLYRGTIGKLTDDGARYGLEAMAKKAGITKKFTPHWFRHTFVSQLVDSGANPKDVQIVAGHSSFRSTEKYLWAIGKTVANLYPVQFGPQNGLGQ